MLDLTQAAITAGFSSANVANVTNFGQIKALPIVQDDILALEVETNLQGDALVASYEVYGTDTFFEYEDYSQFTTRIAVETFKVIAENNILTSPQDKDTDIAIAISFTDIQLEALKFLIDNNLLSSELITNAQLYTTKTKLKSLQITYDHNIAIANNSPDTEYLQELDITSSEWKEMIERERELVNSDNQLISTTSAIFGPNARSTGKGLSLLQTTDKSSIVGAVNEVKGVSDYAQSAATTATTSVGNLNSLITTDKSSAVAAINEIQTTLNAGGGTSDSRIGDLNTLTTTAKNLVVAAINEIHDSYFDTAGDGLTSSGNTVNVNPGNGITIDANGVSLTYQVGDLTTMSSNPSSVVEALGTMTLTTTDDTVIGAINELDDSKFEVAGNGLTSSGTIVNIAATDNSILVNADSIQVQIANTGTYPYGLEVTTDATGNDGLAAKIDSDTVLFDSTTGALKTPIKVRNAADTTDINIDIAVGGTTPTGAENGLAKLNDDLSNRDSIVMASNSLFAQKLPFLTVFCKEDQADTTSLLAAVLIDSTNYITSGGTNVYRCLDLVARVAKGMNSGTKTVNAANKAACETLVDYAVINEIGGDLEEALTEGLDLLGVVKAEICAQFDI